MNPTIFFDGQFWVGVAEDNEPDGLRIFRHVFGAEPGSVDVLHFVNHRILFLFESALAHPDCTETQIKDLNPKRRKRLAAKLLKIRPVSTKSQLALTAERDQLKQERKQISREDKELLDERKRQIKHQKAKEKHRGR